MVSRLSRAERRLRTRDDLINAAIRLFARNGVGHTSVESVAEEAGYSRGAYHSNFETREDLLDAVMSQIVRSLAPELNEILTDDSDALTRLGRYITRFLAFCAQSPEETRALVAVVAYRALHAEGSYAQGAQASITDLQVLFREGQATGVMRQFDTELLAGILRRSLDTEALRVAEGGSASRASAELTEIFVRATRHDER